MIQGRKIARTPDIVKKAITELENDRGPEPEGINAELFKNGTEKSMEALRYTCNKYLERLTYITAMNMKDSKTECKNYIGRILRDVVNEEYTNKEREEQGDFWDGR